MIRKTLIAVGVLALAAGPAFVTSEFLTDYSMLQPQESEKATDLIYVAPGADENFSAPELRNLHELGAN